ncbi:MAG: phenylalanine--tRNA ligase subunit beta [Bacilli bacterium]|nr:phenylalanine--tRNA ligase subunit beta [Bacilli bacterium]
MKVSLKWLNQFVKVDDIDPEVLASKMTFAGVEVEEVLTLAKATGLTIGHIIECEEHPNSDHLHVLKVDEGKYGIHQIVCGAPNARKGLKVIVAKEGAVLPEVTIVKSTIRGVESDGMCCALYELGVDKKYLSEKQVSGIEELPEDAPVGIDNVLEYLGLDDSILDLKLLANRSDMNAMENVAREVGALLNRPVSFPTYKVEGKFKSEYTVASKTQKCPLFGMREIKGIKTKPSPKWMQEILTAEGVRSINNVVDIGNFVMLLTGQPLNMYDADKLPAKELVAVDDVEGPFVAMDDKTYNLEKNDLLISSGGEGMCLGGIMTSKACEVDENTTHVLLEAAVFNGASIRRTSNRLGLASESSARFVKGINPDQNEYVMEVTCALLKDLCEATAASETVIYDTLNHDKKVVNTSLSYINGRLGTNFSMEEVVEVLSRDHLAPVVDGDSITVGIPPYRIDMKEGCDVSEEVIRLLGFENITSRLPASNPEVKGGYTPKQLNKQAVRRFLRYSGLSECLTYSLIDEKHKDSFCYLDNGENYVLMNPLTDDRKVLRKNTLYSLLSVASYNIAHQEKDLAIFEISDVDSKAKASTHLSIVLAGISHERGDLVKKPYDFYDAKGLVEGILSLLGIKENRYRIARIDTDKAEFHPGRSAAIYVGRDLVGVMGELHPAALKEFGLGKSCVGVELDLNYLLDLKVGQDKASIPPRFPSMSRDLALVIGKGVNYADIKNDIKKTDRLVENVSVFDVYEGEHIGAGKKSLAISISFRSADKTLTDPEVSSVMDKIISALRIKYNAEVRS